MNCKHCGKEISLRYGADYNDMLLERQECFSCNHYVTSQEQNPKTTLIVGGEMYTVKPENDNTPARWRGYAGSLFLFKFMDSEVVYRSTNMWHRGTIPDALRPQMQDNAEWVKGQSHIIETAVPLV